MATRAVLAELTAGYERATGVPVAIESLGGVDAARRVRAGEPFDLVVLAADAIDRLIADGHVQAGSRIDLVRSGVAVAVRAGTELPDVGSEEAVRSAVLAAPSIGHSTGPSGTALLDLFQRWGIGETVRGRIVQAPSGVPVALLVARGEVALGFQQLSELLHVEGIQIAGPLPPAIQIVTTFSAGLPVSRPPGSAKDKQVRALLDCLNAPPSAEVKRRHGMEPAEPSKKQEAP